MSLPPTSFPSCTGPEPPSTSQTGNSPDSVARRHLRPVHLFFSGYAPNYPVICVWGLARLGLLADSCPNNFEDCYVGVVEAVSKLNRAVQSVNTEIRVAHVLNSLKWYRHEMQLVWYHEKKREMVGEVGKQLNGVKEGGDGVAGRVAGAEGEIAIKERNHVDKGKGNEEMIAWAKGMKTVEKEEEGYYDHLQDKVVMPCVVC